MKSSGSDGFGTNGLIYKKTNSAAANMIKDKSSIRKIPVGLTKQTANTTKIKVPLCNRLHDMFDNTVRVCIRGRSSIF